MSAGAFYGDYVGASTMGGKLLINNGTFQGGYTYGIMQFGGGDISIARANIFSGRTTYNYQFALGAYSPSGQYYSFDSWLAKGASFDRSFQVGYWNMQSSVTAYPTMSNYWAVAYNTPQLRVTTSVKAPKGTSISSLTAGRKALTVKWKKQTKKNNGYVIQYSTSRKFKGASKSKAKLSRLRSGKKYYVRIRTYRSYNGGTLYSGWSRLKSKKTK